MAALFRPLAARPALRRLPGARPAALARRPLLAPAMAAAGPSAARPVVTVCGTEPSTFGGETPFILLARVQVKPGMVDAYLEAAAAADKGVMESEPGMLHHTVSAPLRPSGSQAGAVAETLRRCATWACRPLNCILVGVAVGRVARR